MRSSVLSVQLNLLNEDADVEVELRALLGEVAGRLPAGAVSAAGHSAKAWRDVSITTSGGGRLPG